MPKVSVIIPLYNAGPHLKACLDSIKSQTLNDFEVIIMADAPTDGSDAVAESYCQQDSRFRLVHNEQNQHIGNSRNRGMSLANGTYITFSDHDDTHAHNWLETMHLQAESTQADITIALPHTTLQHDETNIEAFPTSAFKNTRDFILCDLLTNGSKNQRNNSLFNLVIGNFYRTDFLRANNIQFVDTREITPEDHIFQLQASLSTLHITLVNEILYFHQNHTTNEGSRESYLNIDKRIRGLEYTEQTLAKSSVTNDLISFFRQGAALQLIRLLAQTIHQKPQEVFSTIKTIKSHPLCKKVMPFAPKSSKGFPQKLFRRLLIQLLK